MDKKPSQWFVLRGSGVREGPYSPDQLRDSARRGLIHPDTLLWKHGMADGEPARKFKGLVFVPTRTTEHLSLLDSCTNWLPVMARHIDEAAGRIREQTGEMPLNGMVEISRDIGIIALAAFPQLLSQSPATVANEVVRLVGDVLRSLETPSQKILVNHWEASQVVDALRAAQETTGNDGAWKWSLEGVPKSVHHVYVSSDHLGTHRANTLRDVLGTYCSQLMSVSGLSTDGKAEAEQKIREWLACPVPLEWQVQSVSPVATVSAPVALVGGQLKGANPISDNEYIRFVAGVTVFAPSLLRAISETHLHLHKDPTNVLSPNEIVEEDLKFLAAWVLAATHAEHVERYRTPNRRHGGFRGVRFGTSLEEVRNLLDLSHLLTRQEGRASWFQSAGLPEESYGGTPFLLRLDFTNDKAELFRVLMHTNTKCGVKAYEALQSKLCGEYGDPVHEESSRSDKVCTWRCGDDVVELRGDMLDNGGYVTATFHRCGQEPSDVLGIEAEILKDAFALLRGAQADKTHFFEARKEHPFPYSLEHHLDASGFCHDAWRAVLFDQVAAYRRAGRCETLELLMTCDSICGTSHAAHMRSIFLRICNLLCKADGEVSEREKLALGDIEKFLNGQFGREGAESGMASPVGGNEATGLAGLLADLHSLTGLVTVK